MVPARVLIIGIPDRKKSCMNRNLHLQTWSCAFIIFRIGNWYSETCLNIEIVCEGSRRRLLLVVRCRRHPWRPSSSIVDLQCPWWPAFLPLVTAVDSHAWRNFLFALGYTENTLRTTTSASSLMISENIQSLDRRHPSASSVAVVSVVCCLCARVVVVLICQH